jgi:hypothetical protein
MRYEVAGSDSYPDIHFGATMSGFGQFGRAPGDLVRWHRRLPALRRLIAWILGIERLNNIEYSLSLLIRFAMCALCPSAVEVVEVNIGERTQSMRLLAGVVMNFPFSPLPFDPEVHIQDTMLSLNFIPYSGRLASFLLLFSPRHFVRKGLQIRIGNSDRVKVSLVNKENVEFFIDEDPLVLHSSTLIQIAGTLAFVPGQHYRWPREEGDSL